MFALTIAVFFGLILGSFGSVLLSRRGDSTTLSQASSILWGRSQCPHCKHTLHARDLVPVLSFFLQWGKCRYCHKKISRLYPILEIWSALIFWLITWYLGDQAGLLEIIFWCGQGRILWLLLVYDVLWYEVHIPLVMLWGVLTLGAMIVSILPRGSFLGGISFLLFFLLMYAFARGLVQFKYGVKEEGLWMGDVIVAPFLGTLFFGALPSGLILIDQVMLFLLFLTLSGAIGIIWYGIQNKLFSHKPTFLPKAMAQQGVPFLPAMILAVALIMVFQSYFLAFFRF